jgi:glyoxylase-like metal-dependent hydrolase (beta-lactamase superfamily II)
MGVVRYPVGDATLVRVPYVDVLVDAEVVGLTAEQVAPKDWANPTWAEGEQVRVGAAVWIIESEGRRIVVDPTQAADDILRADDAAFHQEAVAAVLADAGYPRESIDTVLASHIDGIGMIAWRTTDGWEPFFPNAKILMSQRESDAILVDGPYEPSGGDAYRALYEQGAVTTVKDEHTVTADVTMQWTGAHSPGHTLVHVGTGDNRATLIGHLALTPVHLEIPDCVLHEDVPRARAALAPLADGRLLIGPLFPEPGAVRWTNDTIETAAPLEV